MNESIKLNLLIHDLANKLTVLDFQLSQAAKLTEEHPAHEKVLSALRTVDIIKGVCFSYRENKNTAFDLNEALSTALTNYREISGECDLALKPGPKVTVECDPNLFENALHNIILNAISAGATMIVVKYTAHRLIIQDNGNGVSPEQLEQMNKSISTSPYKGRGHGIKSLFYFAFVSKWNIYFKQHSSDCDFKSGVTVEFDF
ncbi:MAG: HAMP domain-containing histidine kinase [Bacteriovoracaceae bacterium]|nr:HAMP domain-containing histidine kinase [Bacteriovoracaceae bacterium]